MTARKTVIRLYYILRWKVMLFSAWLSGVLVGVRACPLGSGSVKTPSSAMRVRFLSGDSC
jgi:hypothetical protein